MESRKYPLFGPLLGDPLPFLMQWVISPEGSLREARKRDPRPGPGTSPAVPETHSKS